MADREPTAAEGRSALPLSASGPLAVSDDGAPPAGQKEKLQESSQSLACLTSYGDTVTQPYPPSPKMLRKQAAAQAEKPTEEHLSKRLEELKEERSRAEARLQSLKKRRADLSASSEVMKEQVREHYEGMRTALQSDEQAVLDALEVDLTETSVKLTRVLKEWKQHMGQVQKSIALTERELGRGGAEGTAQDYPQNLSYPKKLDSTEESIRLNEDSFQKLLKTLRSISKDLKAQLQRKTPMLDYSKVLIDRSTCHSQIRVSADGRGICTSTEPCSAPPLPLQFDKVHCALGKVALATGRHYWEVDVHCCSAWAVGVAYSRLERKGRDKCAELGRNRHSWCVELRDGRLVAWHNDRHVACAQTGGRGPPGRVAVHVHYGRGRLAFYDAGTMRTLHEFSASVAPLFDRAQHQFTEPLYPAFRFFKPQEAQLFPSHMEICEL